MKVNVHIEADDADIRRLATELLAKGVLTTIRGIGETFGDPEFVQGLQGVFGQMFKQGIQIGQTASAGPRGPFPHAHHGQPQEPNPIGVGDVGPVAAPVGAAQKCFRIPANEVSDEGIGCCRCGIHNAVQRATCRHCGHVICLAIVIVPDVPDAPESVPPSGGEGHSEPAP